MVKIFKCLPLLGLGLMAVGCQDYDAGATEADIKAQKYAREFEKAFGKIDPDQDWSMAGQITANVTIGSMNSYVAIYTDKPFYADTKILDAFQGTNHVFEVIDGTEQVFAIVRENGKTLVAGYFDVVDGKVNITNTPVAKRALLTRAFGDGSAVTKGYVEKDVINARSLEEKYVSGGMYKSLEEWRTYATEQAALGNMTTSNYAPFSSDCVKPAYYDFSAAVINPAKAVKSDKEGYYWNGQVWTLEELRAWGEANKDNGTFDMGNYSQKTPFNTDCVKPEGLNWTNAQPDPSKVGIATKDGYWVSLTNQYAPATYGSYSLDEIVEAVKKRDNIAYNHDPLTSSFLVYNPATYSYDFDWSKAEVESKYAIVHSGDYIYNNEVKTLDQLIEIAKVNSASNPTNTEPILYSSVHEVAHFDFTSATINTTDKTRQYGIEVHPGGYVYDLTYYADDAAMQDKVRTADLQNNGPFTNCWFPAYLDFSDATLDPATPKGKDPNAWMIDLTYLNGVETEAAQPWTLELGYQLFGPGSFFMEDEYYFGKKNKQDKTELYGSTPEEKLATMQKIEAGFSITTKQGSEIEVPFIYGATNISDQFGYVYYKDGQDPLTQPHYILMKNGKPTTNIYYNEWGVDANAVGEMSLSGWRTKNDDKVTPIDDGQPLYGMNFDTKVYGTKYKLSFFGENHDKTASYQFDAGYHIVFFICPGTIDASDPRGVSGHSNININYSLPELNARIFYGHMYEGSTNATFPSLTYTAGKNPEGIVKAAAWTSNGMTFMGFEDGGGDEDLNDIVFWVEGDYTPDQNLVEVNTYVKNNTLSWIFACEDLGGTFDYDFNDVVWEFAKDYDVVSETKVERDSKGNIIRIIEGDPAPIYKGAKINLLAAGGTLPIELLYDNVALENDEKTELHQIFGQSAAQSYSVVNVGAKVSTPAVTLKEFSNSEDVSLETIKSKCKIAVHQNDGTTTYVQAPTIDAPKTGKDNTPQVIVLPGAWEWPQEEVFINTAYPNFKSWTEDKTWANWSESYDSSKTTKR